MLTQHDAAGCLSGGPATAGRRYAVYVAQMIIPLAVGGVTYVIFAVIYFILIVTIGVICLRKGHWIMFIIGIFFPLFWIVGAVMPPTRREEIN